MRACGTYIAHRSNTACTPPSSLRPHAMHCAACYDMTASAAERRAFTNRQVFVTVMFETAAAFKNLDAIAAAMDGIDPLTIGRADLAQDLGMFGTPDQARMLDDKRDLVLAAAKKHGKTCAMLCSSYEQAKHWKQAGACCWRIPATAKCCTLGTPRQWRGSRDRYPRRLSVAFETSARIRRSASDCGRRCSSWCPLDGEGNWHRPRI